MDAKKRGREKWEMFEKEKKKLCEKKVFKKKIQTISTLSKF